MRVFDPVVIARQFLMVRETEGPNRGRFVDSFSVFAGAQLGSSWCASFLNVVLWIVYQGSPGLPISASTEVLRKACQDAGWLVTDPQYGDLYFRVHPPGDPLAGQAHHVGLVTGVGSGQFVAVAGNTSPDGTSSEGDGVYEHTISGDAATIVFARLPK